MSEPRNYMPGLLLSKGRSPNIFGCSLSIWIVFNLFALLAAILQMCSNLSVIYLRCFPEPRAKFQLLLAWAEQNLLPSVRLKISSHLGNHITPMPHADLWATKTLPRALVKSCVPSPPHVRSRTWSNICLPKSSSCTIQPSSLSLEVTESPELAIRLSLWLWINNQFDPHIF